MKNIWFLWLLMPLMTQGQLPVISQDGTPMTVLSFKWHRDRQSVFYEPAGTIPAPAMIPANKNFEKNRRANTSPGERDPNQDTLDGRSAALENAIQASRAPKPIEGFAFRAKVHNGGGKPTEVIFWEYQFKDLSGEVISRKQFLCVAAIKPEKAKELQAFSVSAPADVVSVGTLSNKPGDSSNGQVVINRVEYSDGSIWQRKDWKFAEIRLSYARAVQTPWGNEMCRGL